MSGIIIRNMNATTGITHIRMGRRNIGFSQPQLEAIDPEWVTEAGYLGEFYYDDEVNIIFEVYDPSNVIASYKLVGSLPLGVFLSTVGGSLYGYIEDTASASYAFDIAIVTIDGTEVVQSFTMDTVITTESIEWETDSDLGTYGAGSTVDQDIEANVVEEG